MQKWEYLMMDRVYGVKGLEGGEAANIDKRRWYWPDNPSDDSTIQQRLNQLGELGWEMVSMVMLDVNHMLLTMKKPKEG
jgi:hypothetical protein